MASFEDRLLVAETMLASFKTGAMPNKIGTLDDDVAEAIIEETAKHCRITRGSDRGASGNAAVNWAPEGVDLGAPKGDRRSTGGRRAAIGSTATGELRQLVKEVLGKVGGVTRFISGSGLERLRHWRDRTLRLLATSVRASDIER
jgi:hypothetical protein